MKGEAAAPPIKFCVFESAFLLSESVFPQRNLYDEAILTHHKGSFSSSRLGKVCKPTLLSHRSVG